MKKIILSALIVLSTLTTISADELNKIEDFESLLNDVSEIATRKSLNVDYMPSVVTIIDAQTYMDAGIQNIGEALGMLPGIQTQTSSMGYATTTVRGLKTPNAYISDKIKVLIDGVAIHNEISGTSNFYMDFPMQLVDKIEVLRGPGSTVYGSGAFYGTVNVITKLGNSKKENQVFLGGGSYKYMTAGTNVYTTADNWTLFADGYYQQNEKRLNQPDQEQRTDEHMEDLSLGFRAVNGGFEFLTRLKQNTSGNFYSFEGELDPIPDHPKEHKNVYFFAEASYKIDLNDYKLETKAGFSHRESDIGANIDNVAAIANRFSVVGINVQEGFTTQEKTQEQNLELESILTFPEISSNDILVGVGIRNARVMQDDYYNSVENAITQNYTAITTSVNFGSFRYRPYKEPAFWENPTTQLLKANLSRTIGYAYLQDLISLRDDVDLFLGVRIDDYSDFGAKLSKRAGIVYRATDKTVLKLLYGSAFRAPTFTEAYSNGHINLRQSDENIKPEETNTYEAVWIYTPTLKHKFSLNLFYSELNNVIDLEEDESTPAGYKNYDNRSSQGLEFEYSYRTQLEHSLYFNASYIETNYEVPYEGGASALPEEQTGYIQSMPDISKLMLKAMYIYRPTNKLSFGTTWHYYSKTTPTEISWVDESSVEPVNIFDETLTYRFSSLSEMRVTVKNLFDADVRQPSYYYNISGGVQREGRNYMLSYVYRF